VWTQGPLRYDVLDKQLRALMPAGFAYPDVNVVDREAGYPTRAMTGAELDLALASAGQVAGRVALYSAGTIGAADMAHVPSALGGPAVTFDDGVAAPWGVTVRAPGGSAFTRLKVDAHQWPAGAGVAVVPAGTHRLEWSKGTPAGPALTRFTGELGTASVSRSAMTLRYDSRAVVYALFDRKPVGRSSVANPAGGYSIRLAPGRHAVTLSFGRSGHSNGGRTLTIVIVVAVVVADIAGASAYRRLRRH
jgi:hypothetical protein